MFGSTFRGGYSYDDPFDTLAWMQRRLNSIFDEAAHNWETQSAGLIGPGEGSSQEQGQARDQGKTTTSGALTTPVFGSSFTWRPHFDVTESKDNFNIIAEIPGVNKNDVNVEIKNGYLTISGTKHHEERKEDERLVRRERMYGQFSRSIRVPEAVKPEEVKATFDNGVLRVTIPKPPEQKLETQRIAIQ